MMNIGSNNCAFGAAAMQNNTSGFENAAFGNEALKTGTNGYYNSAFGTGSLFSNSGNSNSAVGYQSLYGNTGSANSALGRSALSGAGAGVHNSAIGFEAGKTIQGGQFNTMLGSATDVDSGARNYCVCIGRKATSPAVDGSLAIGGTGGDAMGNLVNASAGVPTGTFLNIYLNGSRYKIALLNP